MLSIPAPDYIIPWSDPNGTDMDDVAGVSLLDGVDGEVQDGFAVPPINEESIWEFTGARTDDNVGYEGSFRFPSGAAGALALFFLTDAGSEAGLSLGYESGGGAFLLRQLGVGILDSFAYAPAADEEVAWFVVIRPNGANKDIDVYLDTGSGYQLRLSSTGSPEGAQTGLVSEAGGTAIEFGPLTVGPWTAQQDVSAAESLPAFVDAASADAEEPQAAAVGAESLPIFEDAATVAFTAPQAGAVASVELPAFTDAAVAAAEEPEAGAVAVDVLPAFMDAAIGTALEPQAGGVVAEVLPAFADAAAPTFVEPEASAVAGEALPVFADSAIPAFVEPQAGAVIADALPAFTDVALAAGAEPQAGGVAAETLPAFADTSTSTFLEAQSIAIAVELLPPFSDAATSTAIAEPTAALVIELLPPISDQGAASASAASPALRSPMAHLWNHEGRVYRHQPQRTALAGTGDTFVPIPTPAALNCRPDQNWGGTQQDRGPGEQQATRRRWFFDAAVPLEERDVVDVISGPEAPLRIRALSVTRPADPYAVHHLEADAEVWHGSLPGDA